MDTENWDLLNALDVVTILAISNRPGTDFLQSLFDSHPQIITFDGWLLFHEFYQSAYSIYGTKRLIAGVSSNIKTGRLDVINVRDFFYEFAWNHLYKFDSRYDNLESKESLGAQKNQYNYVNIDSFVQYAVQLIGDNDLTSRNALLATYGAYALAREKI